MALDANTKLLLQFNGDYTDATGNHTATAGTGVTINSAGKFSQCAAFDGSGGVTINSSSDWVAGTNDFTVDFWLYVNSFPGGYSNEYVLMRQANNMYYLAFHSTRGLIASDDLSYTNSVQQGGFSGWSAGTWYHIALVRYGNTFTIYRNGVNIAQNTSFTASWGSVDQNLILGSPMSGWQYLTGKIDEFRWSNCARWTANFTPPTEPYIVKRFSKSSSLASARENIIASMSSRAQATRYFVHASHSSRAAAYERLKVINASRASARAITGTIQSARADARQTVNAAHSSRFEVREKHEIKTTNRSRIYNQSGWELFAENAETNEVFYLGFVGVDDVSKTLANVILPYGTWLIDARPCVEFWRGVRTRQILTLIITDTGQTVGLPIIENLRREIISYKPRLRWSVAAEYVPADMRFGIWFADAPGFDITTRPPNYSIAYFPGQGEYTYNYTQTDNIYITVAAYTPEATGQPQEIFAEWQKNSPPPPPNQHAKAI